MDKLIYVKTMLTMMSCGMRLSKVTVKELATSINAPYNKWSAKRLMNWIDRKALAKA